MCLPQVGGWEELSFCSGQLGAVSEDLLSLHTAKILTTVHINKAFIAYVSHALSRLYCISVFVNVNIINVLVNSVQQEQK